MLQQNSSAKTADNQTEKAYSDIHCTEHLPLFFGGIGIGSILGVIIGACVFKCIRSRCIQIMRSQNTDASEEEQTFPEGCEKKMPSRRGLFKKDMDETLTEKDVQSIMETMKSVGVFRVSKRAVGTVVRVGEKSVLTAWHILERTVCPPGKFNIDGKADLEVYPQYLKDIDVAFNGKSFGVLPHIPFFDRNLDICLLELIVTEGEASHLPPPTSLYRDFKTMKWFGTEPRCVHVIGLHPVTSEIVLDPGCKIISPDDKIVQKAKKWTYSNKMYIEMNFQGKEKVNIDATYADVLNTETNLIINTYLEFGGSGGAVLAFTHDRKVALVAILLKGLPPWYWNMRQGCEFPKYLRMEVGCHITSILGSPNWTAEEKKRIFEEESMETDFYSDENIENSVSRLCID
ncbi:uncharacterized protein LOC123555235 [Mercenaria mercenaria]|uniref:uncharacterized protein LOC123555235 n=1 Tax=Mercenaria mercenaria TaxID=6596 RepID=UPI00234FA7F4|nr:uncharacterized protein LOC123555235 [Mercenaria mercenaria]